MVSDPFDLGADDVNDNTASHAPEPALPGHSDTMPEYAARDGEALSLSQRAAARMPLDAGNGVNSELAQSMEDMNPEQREAVLAPDGPLLVLAGAGTGKTRVLTTRIAHKISTKQAWPSQFLAVTFTNKSAREMKDRISGLVGEQVEGMPWLGTFHSISAKILRRHAELVGLRPDFTILDTDDQIRLLRQLIKSENIDDKRWPARQLAFLVDRWKNRGWQPHQVPAGEAGSFADGAAGKLYENYQNRLKILNAVDFGDLLLECLRLFQENNEILQEYQDRFRHMLVDEYQDTNAVQYLWLRLLAQKHHNICCVGDDDQSIYGWRGAEVDNILRFEKDFPGAGIIRLERNYRSTPHILGAASGLIEANKNRLGKTLWTQENAGDKVRLRGSWDGEEEARVTADDIEALQRKGHNLNEVAILLRASFQMREFEDRFMQLGLPYRVIGGPRFYERAEIRDANAYLRLIAQPDDDLAFERICNKPRRGLGDVALQNIHGTARQNSISLMRAARILIDSDELKPAARRSLSGFVASIDRWRNQKDSVPHNELAQIVLDESGYTQMWMDDKSPEAPGKLDNLKELIRFMDDFGSLNAYLEHISLIMDAETNDSEEKVSLMTLHAAKGLEFLTVFLPGWEEGLFPHQRSLDETGDRGLEEERRLAYVGITRAKENITISFAGNRRIHGQWQAAIPSRFIDELPEEHVEPLDADIGYNQNQNFQDTSQSQFVEHSSSDTYSSPGWQRMQRNRAAREQNKTINVKVQKTSSAHSSFKIGERVFHQKFGYGKIGEMDGNKLTVHFEKAGTKKVIDSFLQQV